MNVRQLEAFRAVIETGSVTRAGAALGISQPAISKLLTNLARACGFTLFRRRANRLIPTPEAMILFGEVERVFIGVESVQRLANDIRDLRSGQLAIVAFPAITTRVLPRIVTRFRDAHPDAAVSLVSRSSRALVDWVAGQRADVGISLMTVETPNVVYEPLGAFSGVCVMHPCHRLAARATIVPADLDGEAFIEIGSEDRSRFRVDQAFEGKRVRRRPVIEAQQAEAACSFAAAGAGISIVEPFSASGFRADELAVRPFLPVVTFDMWLMFPGFRPRTQLTDAFLDIFRREVEHYRR